jgi:hypothetical protein
LFKNSNNDNDMEVGHTRSGRALREVPLPNLFKKNYEDEGFYNGKETDLIDEEHLESTRAEEWNTEEPR